MHELEKENSLTGHALLPLTIHDAIIACVKLNVPYLWVDRLCIVQDDHITKSKQLDSMSYIYRHAYMTLVALEGTDANHGLPRVTKHRNTVPRTFQVQDFY